MQGLLLSFTLWWGPILAISLALASIKAIRLDIRWLIASFLIFALGFAGNIIGDALIDEERLIPVAWAWEWNWAGKLGEIIIAIIAIFVVTSVARGKRLADAGFTAKWRVGSVAPAIFVGAFLVLAAMALNVVLTDQGDAPGASLERFVFQATMPGFAEEPMYRGALLLALTLAASSRPVTIYGAPIDFAGALTVILFKLGHGPYFTEGAIRADWVAMGYSAFMAIGLLWLRQRTGTLVAPIIAHNAVNFFGSAAAAVARAAG